MSSNDFLTVSEVAELLRVSDETVYRLCRRGELKASRAGIQWRIKRTSVDEYLSRGQEGYQVSMKEETKEAK